MKNKETSFSPAEICEWFSIPRTTLFRWEKDGIIPPTERHGSRGDRIYRQDHVRRIFNVVRGHMRRELAAAQKADPYDSFPSMEMQERLYLAEFFGSESQKDGLRQLRGLANRRDLKPETIRKVVAVALGRERGDALRVEIWQFLLEYDQRARK